MFWVFIESSCWLSASLCADDFRVDSLQDFPIDHFGSLDYRRATYHIFLLLQRNRSLRPTQQNATTRCSWSYPAVQLAVSARKGECRTCICQSFATFCLSSRQRTFVESAVPVAPSERQATMHLFGSACARRRGPESIRTVGPACLTRSKLWRRRKSTGKVFSGWLGRCVPVFQPVLDGPAHLLLAKEFEG